MSSTSLPLPGHRLALVRSVRVAALDDAALARSLIEGEAVVTILHVEAGRAGAVTGISIIGLSATF
ncbi:MULTISPECIES: hypothetical protein [Sorangium]|uniref:hypothetical protein n=1 Tax=Sorangium TaxID=39643 RepID=UPI003D9C191B